MAVSVLTKVYIASSISPGDSNFLSCSCREKSVFHRYLIPTPLILNIIIVGTNHVYHCQSTWKRPSEKNPGDSDMSNAYFSSLRYLIESLANLTTICLSDLGTLSVLPRPSAEDLGSAVYSSCVKLIRHIASQAQPYVTSHSQDQNNPKEVEKLKLVSLVSSPAYFSPLCAKNRLRMRLGLSELQ